MRKTPTFVFAHPEKGRCAAKRLQTLCLVVPCYNEAKRLPVDEFCAFVAQTSLPVHFLFVNDGSTDTTQQVLDDLAQRHPTFFSALHLHPNAGKAAAVRTGMLHLLAAPQPPAWLGFLDADLATPLPEMARLYQQLAHYPQLEFAVGSRWAHLGANIQRRGYRHYTGRIIATAISQILRLGVYDTQCGMKFIKSTAAAALFQEPFISPWLFDVELFARQIIRQGYAQMPQTALEMPLQVWVEKGESKIRYLDVLRIPLELLRIRNRYRKALIAAGR